MVTTTPDLLEEAPAPTRRGRWRAVLAGAVVAPFAVWAVARLFGLEAGFPLVQLMAFTPYVAGAAVLVAAAVLALRRWMAGAVAAVAAVALVGVFIPRVVADGAALPTGPTVRVFSANLLAGEGDEQAVLALVRKLDVDVLFLQEFTPDDAEGLNGAGILDVLPYQAAYPQYGVVGSAAHPTAPAGPRLMRHWARDLRQQPRATPTGTLRVLAGDFNSTLDHAALRTLIDSGYRDVAAVDGSGWRATWPYDEKWYIPGVTLDRVLADRRIGVKAARPYDIPGGDHKAVYAELVLPAA
jgi:endonuclease/exonuclease/phosphatase (EEP) superfamily protein YafD